MEYNAVAMELVNLLEHSPAFFTGTVFVVGLLVGSFLNVVQDPNDPGFATGDPSSLASALQQSTGRFAQVLADGTTLYTASLDLGGDISGLPYPVGTQLFYGNDAEIRLQLGAVPDPVGDPVVGLFLSGGFVDVIPEPSGFGLAIVGVAAFAGFRRRQRRLTLP